MVHGLETIIMMNSQSDPDAYALGFIEREDKMRIGEIEAIIWKHFNKAPEERAARELWGHGIREKDLVEAKYIPKPLVLKVQNVLRDMERGR